MTVEIRNLSRRFGRDAERPVLQDITLQVASGEYVAIMGESGAGKSTLLNLIAGLDRPDSGTVLIDGVDLGTLDDDGRTLLRRRRMGFVFQAFHVLPYLSVARNVALPLALNGISGAAADFRLGELLAAVGLADRADSAPGELSGGEMQRVAIARALANRPRLLLADEPTGELDQSTGDQIVRLLDQVHATGTAVVVVTHDAGVAARAHRLVTMRDGRIVEDRRR